MVVQCLTTCVPRVTWIFSTKLMLKQFFFIIKIPLNTFCFNTRFSFSPFIALFHLKFPPTIESMTQNYHSIHFNPYKWLFINRIYKNWNIRIFSSTSWRTAPTSNAIANNNSRPHAQLVQHAHTHETQINIHSALTN